MATARRTRKCGICREPGHNARTCPAKETQAQTSPSEPSGPPSSGAVSSSPDLGRLRLGRKQVIVSLLPSQAASVMIKYQPNVQISCVIPPQTFEVSYSARMATRQTHEIETPTLIMGCEYGDIPNARNMRAMKTYSLWAIDTARKDKIYAKSYTFSNVWDNGKICFGGLKPASLRQAYNQFWSSSFNHDLLRDVHICDNKRHTWTYHRGHKCDPSKKDHQCACPKVTFHKHRGCGCTTVVKSKKCKASCGSQFSDMCDCCIAIKQRQDAARLENPNITQKQLDKLVTLSSGDPYPGCGCTFRHKRGCRCAKNTCDCVCYCACCTGSCDHGECTCRCCKNTCNCRCACTTAQKLDFHIKNYHEKILPKKKWTDRTNVFCGTKFWASPEGSTGILVTNERTLLNLIPRRYWRKDNNGHALIIASAHHKGDHWLFKSGGFTFELDESYVTAS